VAIKLSLHGIDLGVISIYNMPTCSIDSGVWGRLQNTQEDFILCGDLNCRSKVLGGVGSNSNGDLLENVILNNDFLVLNDSSPTFNRKNYAELLDYIISTSPIASK
jgi:hypothetical protein